NSIQYLDNPTVLKDEAGCLTGLQVVGTSTLEPYTAHDPGSAYCQMVIGMVQRNADGTINTVHSGPINEASLYVSGVDASLDYKWRSESYGDFTANIVYTDNLSYKQRVLASDPLLNTRNNNGGCNVLDNGIQPGMGTATAANGTVYSTGVCTVSYNGGTEVVNDTMYM